MDGVDNIILQEMLVARVLTQHDLDAFLFEVICECLLAPSLDA